MTYNHAPRRSLTTLQRAKLFESHGGLCHICRQKIQIGEPWDVEHVIARELLGPMADEADNLAPAHRACHRRKTAADVALIAKSNRVAAKHTGARKPGWNTGPRRAPTPVKYLDYGPQEPSP